MNLILFESQETPLPLPRTDRRAIHLLEVMRRQPGETFDAGMVNGARGKGTITSIDEKTLRLSFQWEAEPPALHPITLIVGLPRPQSARKILQEATTLGVARIHFVTTERAEPSYATSSLWQGGEWRRHLIVGAEQAFCTRLPEVSHGKTLVDIVAALPADASRIALDNYEAPAPLSEAKFGGGHAILAIGAERGWSAHERELLRQAAFRFAHMGLRVLRIETACVAAVAVVKAQNRWH